MDIFCRVTTCFSTIVGCIVKSVSNKPATDYRGAWIEFSRVQLFLAQIRRKKSEKSTFAFLISCVRLVFLLLFQNFLLVSVAV